MAWKHDHTRPVLSLKGIMSTFPDFHPGIYPALDRERLTERMRTAPSGRTSGSNNNHVDVQGFIVY